MRLLITGATGYIGSRLICQALSRGHEVIAASRKPINEHVTWLPFDLNSPFAIRLPDSIDVVLHLAATTDLRALDSAMEVRAAESLIHAAKQVSAKFIFLSSQTASQTAPTAYGKTKYEIERLVREAGGIAVRPGQVYGGTERGLFGMLVNTVRRLLVIPVFLPAPKIQPIHVDDLALALVLCAESEEFKLSIICLGAPKPISFTSFLRIIAKERVQRYRLLVPVPIALVRMVGVVIGEHLRSKFGLDRLMSLFDLPSMKTAHDLKLLGISLRPITSGMTLSGRNRRRNLIREGKGLLTYILKTTPSIALIKRYVRYVESVREGQPLTISSMMYRWPFLFGFLDEPGLKTDGSHAEFALRLNAAVVLAEATTQGARRFLALGSHMGLPVCLSAMLSAVVLEIFWRASRLGANLFMKLRRRSTEL